MFTTVRWWKCDKVDSSLDFHTMALDNMVIKSEIALVSNLWHETQPNVSSVF